MADRRVIILLRLLLLGLIATTAAAGLVMLLAPQSVRQALGWNEPATVALSDEETLLAEDLLADGALPVDEASRQRQLRQWQQMDAVRRRAIQERYAALRWLSPAGRQMLVEQYAQLAEISPQDRQTMREQAEALAEFEMTLGRQDLAMLDGLPPVERARALLSLWRQAQGLQ